MNIFSLSKSPCIMKSLLVFIVGGLLLVGCGQSEHQHSHDDDHHHAEGQSGGHDKDSDGKTGAELKAAARSKASKPQLNHGPTPSTVEC